MDVNGCGYRPALCFLALQFYRDVKDWWLFGFYFCAPLVFSAIFYGLMTSKMLRHQKGSMKVSLSEHLKQVWTNTQASLRVRGLHAARSLSPRSAGK